MPLPVFHWKDETHHLSPRQAQGVTYLACEALEGVPDLIHGFSTRLGGVSEGYLGTMNLGFSVGDEKERVKENYRRLLESLSFSKGQVAAVTQVHTDQVLKVTGQALALAPLGEATLGEADAMVTDEAGILLTVRVADCVPILLVDERHHAIGVCHSGWRGTQKRIAQKTLSLMGQSFGTDPGEVLACVGPSICQDCYEVSQELREAFLESFSSEEVESLFAPGRQEGKYQLSLWEANRLILSQAGVLGEHLFLPGVCTCCNKDLLFSHRGSQGKRGLLVGFLGWRQ